MKRVIILFIAITTRLVVAAQSTEVITHPAVNPGGLYLKGGVNFANISVNNDGAADNANVLTTFNVGFVGDLPLGDILSLQTGIILNGGSARRSCKQFRHHFPTPGAAT